MAVKNSLPINKWLRGFGFLTAINGRKAIYCHLASIQAVEPIGPQPALQAAKATSDSWDCVERVLSCSGVKANFLPFEVTS